MLIFQSIDKKDLDIAHNLYREVLVNGVHKQQGKIELLLPQTVSAPYELAAKLEELRDDCEKDRLLYPWIHLDMHGDRKKGLLFPRTQSYMSWHEFACWCRKINYACANNLTVVSGVCNGFYAIKDITLKYRTPYANLFGPKEKIKGGRLLKALLIFYQEFFNSMNASSAFKKIQSTFNVYVSDFFLINALVRYQRRYCTKDTVQKRTDDILSQLFMQNPDARTSITAMRKFTKERTHRILERGTIEQYYDRFLMASDERNIGRYDMKLYYSLIDAWKRLPNKAKYYQVRV